ncbi:hypothetical protein FHW69_000945 [Luteibacter sp. Sphag1AF]|uniref:DUF2306 domain-containing protein n=1 Tax=Luteibacter sp. Sphag1AF TaxID=2587031 RepID=UPI00181EA3DC|nr:DUF2306 domain-containing protein [Luteibacter sp. Sphag1AF]MBB3226355.1 hypothetical protein [Luteibacter sp. Sphag1AF]
MAGASQLVFASYVVLFYGRAQLASQPQRWNEIMNRGYVKGDVVFNAVLGLHLAMAVAIMLGGFLQLMPRWRQLAPGFHRWNGRIYMLLALGMGVGGLSLIWIRGGAAGDLSQHLGTSFNAVLIIAFAGAAWRHARARRFDAHRRAALRLFLVVSGVWFFRVGLMLWLVVNQGPVGFDPRTFTGPFLTLLAFAQTLLPLAVLEAWLRATKETRPVIQWATAGMLIVCGLATLVGSAAAAAIMWWPNMLPTAG